MGNRTGPRRSPTPGINTKGRAQRLAKLPPAVPPAARGHKPPHPCRGRSDACEAGAARWVPRDYPSTPLGTHRPLWAARDHSGRGLPHPASRERVRCLPDPLCRRRPRRNAHTPLCVSFRSALFGCHKCPSLWRISRSAPTRREGSNLITGVCSISSYYLYNGPGSPPDWSVFMWRIELTWGSPFGRLLPSCISVLSFYRLYFGGYSFFMIARSIDPAPLPSDYKSPMGPGFAVVGTPGSPSDVARTKVLLPPL